MDETKDYFAILGVKPTATQQEVDRAYQKLRKRYHPDYNPGNVEGARAKMQELSEAYRALSLYKIRDFDASTNRRRHKPTKESQTHRVNRYTRPRRDQWISAAVIFAVVLGFAILVTYLLDRQQQEEYPYWDEATEYYEEYERSLTQAAKDSGRLPAAGVAYCTIVAIRDTYGYEPDLKTSVGYIADGTTLIIVPTRDDNWAKIRNRTYGDFIRLSDVEIMSCQQGTAGSQVVDK